ncbi:uncharacterized protein LOC131150460 [Malania oleifera]|uniref:uncharacterized protein LOC131150460 n=1 Tax=Malania oleifera TaxID=397392 RepID=UPI0025AE83CF|nr:uncharacterized protein LOC131150460 [Malania oleifera]
MQDFVALVDKATVVEESLQEDLEVQDPKKILAPSSSYVGAKQGNWKKNSGGNSHSTTTTPTCSKCGRPRSGKCLSGSGTCFHCGRMGHQKKDCRMLMNSKAPQLPYGGGVQAQRGSHHRGTAQARVYSLTSSDAENAGDVVRGTIYMLSNKIVILFDSGVRRLLLEVCQGYLEYVKDTPAGVRELEEILVVCEFPDVFPEDLSGLPPDREVEFGIKLAPRTVPISKASYRMTPAK